MARHKRIQMAMPRSGIAAGVTVALDSNTAEIQRDVSTNGGDITVTASTYKQINAGAKSSAKIFR